VPDGDKLPEPKAFADALTADHKILNDDDASRTMDKTALIILDRFTQWLQSFPCKTKNTEETIEAFQKFLGPNAVAKHVYTDNSKEFEKAMKKLGFSHDTSTPHRSETNGIAERAVRRVKEGTSCTLGQSGLADVWWDLAMACYCFLRCVVDQLVGGHTAYFRRFGKNYDGPVIPLGAEITYQPRDDKDKKRCHQLGEKVLRGIFAGYVQHAGGGWTGDLNVIDWEELENAGHVSEIYLRRSKADEITVIFDAGNNNKHNFPLVDGELSQPGLPTRQRQRRKTRKEKKKERKEAEAEELAEKQEQEPQAEVAPQPDTPTAEADFWTCTSDYLIRHHRTPRTKFYMPTQEELPIPMKYIDVQRQTETNSEHPKERTIYDYWTRPNTTELSAPWTGRTRFYILHHVQHMCC